MVCLRAPRVTVAGATRAPRTTAWYAQAEGTVSDVVALVRRTLGANKYCRTSVEEAACLLLSQTAWETVLDQLAATA